MTRVQAYIYLLILLAIIVGLFVFFSQRPFSMQGARISFAGPEASSGAPIPQPPLTDEIKAELAASHGFQELISYTDNGFEPSALNVSLGDTVRFTNNSHGILRITASGDNLYPAAQNGCSASALDSCRALKPGEFWEFTFTAEGTWGFVDQDKNKTGMITVR